VNPRATLTVQAEFVPLYNPDPPSWFVMNLRKGESTNLTARLTRTDGAQFTVAKAAFSQTNAFVSLQARVAGEPGSSNSVASVIVTARAETGPGYYSGALNVFTAPGGTPACSIPVTIRVVGDLALSREMIYWPITDPAKAAMTQSITITSALPNKLVVSHVSSTVPDLAVEAVRKSDHAFELVAKLSKVPANTTHGLIRFETNVPGQATVERAVAIEVAKP
jgi:hypothetical protein